MKNRLITISSREIKKSYKRFLSLLIMSFLGVGVFVGLRNTPGTMLKSLDKYYDETNHYDLKIVSTLGLTNDDILALNKLGMTSYGIHTKDVITNFKEDTRVIKIIGINEDVNKITLIEGNLPQNEDEIVVERNVLKEENLEIGDSISIDKDESLKNNKFKIVGVVSSPLYLFIGGNAETRGSTDIGVGKVDYYAYVLDKTFDVDYFSEVDLVVPNVFITSSKKYIDLMNEKIDKIEAIKKDREKARYQEIIDKFNIEIDKQEEEGNRKLAAACEALDNAKRELDYGYNELLNAKKELDSTKDQLNQTIITLDLTKDELEDKEKELAELLAQYGLTMEDIVTIKDMIEDKEVTKDRVKHIFQNSPNKEQIEQLIDDLYEDDFFNNLKEFIENGTEAAKQALINSIPTDVDNYDEIVAEIEAFNKDTVKEGIFDSIISSAENIDAIKNMVPLTIPNRDNLLNFLDQYSDIVLKIKELFEGIEKLISGKEELDNGYNTYYTYLDQYNDGLNKYNVGYNDYKRNLGIYDANLQEYLKNKLDFENEIEKARNKLKEIEMPEWYIYDRSDDSEYSGYINNTDSIKNLSKAFPAVFFLVAIFMCIMSMNRMALEDRAEIGTLKSLGFANNHIILKYVIYSVIATLIGSILGGMFGFYFLTWFISKMYGILYFIPFFAYLHNVGPFVLGTIIALICITGTAILTVMKIVGEKPSELLRPLAPNNGKKILIEDLAIWKKLKFSNKITVRNIVRYKKRVIMTILGIAGCTMLLLAGYGIRDAVTPIADKQFEEVLIYQDAVYLDHETDDIDFIINNKNVKNYEKAYMQAINVDGTAVDLFVVDGENLNYDVINVTDYKNHKKLKVENNKVIISDKLASINNLKVGDKISFTDANNKAYEFEISGISTNYVFFYMYMDIETYEEAFDEYIPNVVFVNLNDGVDEEKVAKEYMKDEHVLSIVTKDVALKNVDAMLKSLNHVVVILIVLSGMLSFVVLYNLSYINISERKREIATLKVLGFTYNEVDNYIIKENFIITFIGILIGLLLGKPFVNYIINTVEIDLVKFIHEINIASYLFTFMFMILFTSIVTVIIHYTLKKIDMIESLKTVE